MLYTAVTQNHSALVYIQKYVTLAGICCSNAVLKLTFPLNWQKILHIHTSHQALSRMLFTGLMCLLFLFVYFSYCSDILPLNPADTEINWASIIYCLLITLTLFKTIYEKEKVSCSLLFIHIFYVMATISERNLKWKLNFFFWTCHYEINVNCAV